MIHLQVEEKRLGGKTVKRESMIFPRYHQLDCVRALVRDAGGRGAGANYLVQHSAGSGKSNSIAWLVHRLSTLHDARDEKVFDSVVVVTDRVVLDQQLQNTIYQFEHRQGVVQKIDRDSAQLAQALGAGVPIVVTTLQKFPFVTEKIGDLPLRKYAVVLDEAHSSQGGETAAELKGVLGGAAIREEARQQAEEQGLADYEEEILTAFKPYYEQTMVGERAEPSQLYELQAKLDGHQVYHKSEVEEFCRVFYKPRQNQTPADHARMNACIDPAVRRYTQLAEEERDEFRKALVAYQNLYAFLSQVIPFQDSDLEKLYSYIRFLLAKLPRGDRGPVYDFDDEVALKYYRLQKISEGRVALESGVGGEVAGPIAVGSRAAHAEKIELSQLIDLLNERFGTDFKPGDQLFLESIREDALADPEFRQAALANTMENFGYVFLKALEGLFIDRMEQNEEITARFINDRQFQDVVGQHLLEKVYEQVRCEQARKEPFERVDPQDADRYRTCIPLYTLEAAAGAFGDGQQVEPDRWVAPRTTRKLSAGMFVARVVGRSMEPRIPDGAWCLFRAPVAGSRQGRIVLVQHQSIHDPEGGGSYTVKRYFSEKEPAGPDGWRHRTIRLMPETPEFEPILLSGVEQGEVAVIAELVEVLA